MPTAEEGFGNMVRNMSRWSVWAIVFSFWIGGTIAAGYFLTPASGLIYLAAFTWGWGARKLINFLPEKG